MSYSIDELFRFEETEGGVSVARYLRNGDENITDITIPEGVTRIGRLAFGITMLKSVALPKSLKEIADEAFAHCTDLESVTFNSAPKLGRQVFFNCVKLPAKTVLMGLVNSCDITEPLDADAFNEQFNGELQWQKPYGKYIYARADVFKLAAENGCFRSVDAAPLLRLLIEEGDAEVIVLAGELINTATLADELIECSVENGKTEATAFLLEYKKRKFGFDGSGEFEL